MSNLKITPGSDNKKKVEITINKELTLNNSSETQKEFLSLIDKYDEFILKTNEIENFDLSGIQLLFSLKQTLEKKGKKLILQINLPGDLKSITDHAGFTNLN